MIYGYARVSTTEQETTLQLDALNRAGADKIEQEKTSSIGKRPVLRALLGTLTKNDQLIVYKLDRLARSLKDLLTIIEQLEQIGCGFKSLTEPIDTTNPAGRLMLNILGSVAEFERSLIRQRSMAGQAAAKLRGAHCGRPRMFSADVEKQIVDRYLAGGVTLDKLAIIYKVHPSVIKRAVYRVVKPGHSSLM
jgi:DNA invertase Pin-like site-specific DNA recombinase